MIPPAKLVEHAEQSVDRPLTAEECAAYFTGVCPPRPALSPDLPLRFGEASYGILPRVQGFYGSVAEFTSWTQNYALKGLLVFLLLLAILMFKSHGHPEELLEEPAE